MEQIFFNWVCGILGSLGLAYLKRVDDEMKNLAAKVEDAKADNNRLRVTLAGDYARRVEMEALSARIDNKFNSLEQKVENGLQRIFDKLDEKADK